MFLRWMVRFDTLDLGLWKKIDKKDLILPLDTHTFKVSKKLGLLENRTYNLKSALEISQKLKEFDANDPIKYDFAIYRLGQEKIIQRTSSIFFITKTPRIYYIRHIFLLKIKKSYQ